MLTPLLRARRPTDEEATIIEPLWAQIAQANGLPAEPLRRARPADRRTERVRLRRASRAGDELRRPRPQPGAVARRPRPRVEPPPRAAHRGDHDRALAVGAGRAARTRRVLPRERRPCRSGQFRAAVAGGECRRIGRRRGHARDCRGCSPRRFAAATPSPTSSATRRSSRPTAARFGWDSDASWRARCASCSRTARDDDRSAGGLGSPPRTPRREHVWPGSRR